MSTLDKDHQNFHREEGFVLSMESLNEYIRLDFDVYSSKEC